ncbi:TetR/AcrR family transcriptional regulator [Streptococcus pluranimalium]
MDKRSKKTQEAIFEAFFSLLNEATFHDITVGKLIERADIGRSTFYSHFTSKDDLLAAVCANLFHHVFVESSYAEHIASDEFVEKDSLNNLLAHLFHHFQENQERVSTLFKLGDEYFSRNLSQELQTYLVPLIIPFYKNKAMLPESFIHHHIKSNFTSTLNWWLKKSPSTSAEEVASYFLVILS